MALSKLPQSSHTCYLTQSYKPRMEMSKSPSKIQNKVLTAEQANLTSTYDRKTKPEHQRRSFMLYGRHESTNMDNSTFPHHGRQTHSTNQTAASWKPPHAVTSANMAEEQSEKTEAIIHEEHNRPAEPINPPKRARTDQHDTTQVGVSKGSVTLVGPGLINNGLIATQEQHESEISCPLRRQKMRTWMR